ncbi:MAG: hypothetical protein WBH14_11125, partial [Albidovulum sp.]
PSCAVRGRGMVMPRSGIWVGGNRASGNEMLQTGGGYRVEFNVAGRIGKGLWRCAFTEGGERA